MKTLVKVVGGGVSALSLMVFSLAASATSHALVLSTTDLETDIGTVRTALLAIGAAVIVLIIAIKAYKWLRRAF